MKNEIAKLVELVDKSMPSKGTKTVTWGLTEVLKSSCIRWNMVTAPI